MCFSLCSGYKDIHISCDMYLRFGLHVQIKLYDVLSYKAKSGIGFILDRCIVYLGLTMPNLQKKRPLIFEIFNIKKYTHFLEPSILCCVILVGNDLLIQLNLLHLVGKICFYAPFTLLRYINHMMKFRWVVCIPFIQQN